MIDVELAIGPEWDIAAFGQTEIEKAVDAAVKVAGHSMLFDPPVPVSVSVKLSDDEEVRDLNRDYRDKDQSTNVLSFPMLDDDDLETVRSGDFAAPEIMLGDIILAHGVCASEAADKHIPLPDHATHLVIHGMLHLLGHDHLADDEADSMEALEVKALASLGLHNPYDDEI